MIIRIILDIIYQEMGQCCYLKIEQKKFLRNIYFKYKNNLLSMRQSMSTDKKIEYQNLVDKIKLKNLEDDSEYVDGSNNNLNEIESMKKDNLFYYRLKRKKEKSIFFFIKSSGKSEW